MIPQYQVNPDLTQKAPPLQSPQVGDNVVDFLWKHDAQYQVLKSRHDHLSDQLTGQASN
jgi:hypothetical protein